MAGEKRKGKPVSKAEARELIRVGRAPTESLYKRAFWNQYNLILLAGAGLFAITTWTWLPLLVGGGIEALWMTFGPDSRLFRRWVVKQEGKEKQEALKKAAAAALESLGGQYIDRFSELERTAEEVRTLAEENPSLETSLIQDELDKLGQMLHVFLQMAVSHQRLHVYLSENSEVDIRRDIAQCERALRSEESPQVQESLRQGLGLAEKRMRQHAHIESEYKSLSVRMDTLEKSMRYLKSHIVAISTREELSDEIGNLITGVGAAESISSETEDMLAELRASRLRQQASK